MSSRITVRVAHLAQDMKTIRVQANSTISMVLGKAEIEAKGDIFINGKRAGLNTVIKSDSIIGIVGQVEGGL
jgi:hypothetical protein